MAGWLRHHQAIVRSCLRRPDRHLWIRHAERGRLFCHPPRWGGEVNAAVVVSAFDFLVAAALISWAGKLRTGPELDLAVEVRDPRNWNAGGTG